VIHSLAADALLFDLDGTIVDSSGVFDALLNLNRP
jgi:beta-phosphoglucomutase-like phosphatase (HAD superfamily)